MNASPYHILIVDDEPAILRTIQRQLSPRGYRISLAASAEEAMTFMDKDGDSVHAVMADLRMPGKDGMELLKDVKQRWPDTVRILNTGYADRRVALAAINEGEVYRIITKPWGRGEVEQTLEDAFRHFQPIWERRDLENQLAEIRRQGTGENGTPSELAKNLLVSNIEMARLERLKSHFVAIASHELLTPIAVMKPTIDMLAEGELEDSPEQRHKAYQTLERSLERLTRISRDLLTVLYQESGDASCGEGKADLGETARDVYEEAQAWKRVRNVAIQFEGPGSQPIFVDIASSCLRQVIRNLLSNAVRYTPDGGQVRIEIGTEEGEQGRTAILRVSDTGSGVPDKEKTEIFRRFYHARGFENHKSGELEFGSQGLGLGLWVVRKVLERAKGSVAVSDRPGGGSVFTVLLPCAGHEETTRMIRDGGGASLGVKLDTSSAKADLTIGGAR